VTEQSCAGAVFNRFTGKFECSSSSQAQQSMVSNQPVQDQFRVPSLVTSDSLEFFESSSRFAKRKRTPIEDSRTSQLLPDTETIATTTGGPPQSRPTTGGDVNAEMLTVFQSHIWSNSVTPECQQT
ncbi:hypothetical protein Tco_1075373, partial [Tanacetum coccineum]